MIMRLFVRRMMAACCPTESERAEMKRIVVLSILAFLALC